MYIWELRVFREGKEKGEKGEEVLGFEGRGKELYAEVPQQIRKVATEIANGLHPVAGSSWAADDGVEL